MRTTHQDNPLHKIERWTGSYFRTAELWEVGAYVLVPHHQGEPLCDRLLLQKQTLETFELKKDTEEQEKLTRWTSAPLAERRPDGRRRAKNRPPTASSDVDPLRPDQDHEGNPGQEAEDQRQRENQDQLDDILFESHLDRLHRQLQRPDGDDEYEPLEDSEFYVEEDDETVVADGDADRDGDAPFLQYLSEQTEDGLIDIPTNDLLNNAYVRIVHTNGLHHLAMVSCRCRGADSLPCDLIASRLLPASFQRIRTLFSAQVLDFFRLCNLEMKASAYQFYHLLCRLTSPMAPAEVVDLYNEFRRMTRLWRWMKKLKWAGYGHNGKNPMDVKPGELANYCPVCPQPGVNLPVNWKEDPHRSVQRHSHNTHHYMFSFRFAYRMVWVADGNFKADHVRQPPLSNSNDVWLGEGGGMVPLRAEYHAFLRTALERQTVCIFCSFPAWPKLIRTCRKRLVKIHSEQLRTLSSLPRHVISLAL